MLTPAALLQRAPEPDMADLMTDQWVTVIEAARRLDLSTKTIYRQLQAGSFPCAAVKVGRVWRIRATDLDLLIAFTKGEEPA